MGWTTIYITGRSDFREEVLKRLEGSGVNFMPGNTGATSDLDTHELYWLNEEADLRKFKRAIGSKLIWKYRLNFFTNLETFIESQNNKKNAPELTPEEHDFLLSVHSSQSSGPRNLD